MIVEEDKDTLELAKDCLNKMIFRNGVLLKNDIIKISKNDLIKLCIDLINLVEEVNKI